MPTDVITTPGAGTWTVPSVVTEITVRAWGSGAAGGGGGPGHGGGGGAFSSKVLAVTPLSDISYQVAVGGTHASPTGADTWFQASDFLMAKGGGTTSNRIGGAAADGFGDVKFSGGDGAEASGDNGGGAGSSAGPAANGNNASGTTGGAAPTGGGAGGNGGIDPGNPTAGASPGGGGGGQSSTSVEAASGGNGRIEIDYTWGDDDGDMRSAQISFAEFQVPSAGGGAAVGKGSITSNLLSRMRLVG